MESKHSCVCVCVRVRVRACPFLFLRICTQTGCHTFPRSKGLIFPNLISPTLIMSKCNAIGTCLCLKRKTNVTICVCLSILQSHWCCLNAVLSPWGWDVNPVLFLLLLSHHRPPTLCQVLLTSHTVFPVFGEGGAKLSERIGLAPQWA